MTSIYEAEVCGKRWVTKMVEDQLTSRVFGALDTLDKHDVLVSFLRQLALDDPDAVLEEKLRSLTNELAELSEEESRRITINLWKYFGDRCPDVHIEIPSRNKLLVIEVKKDSPADHEQIVKQYMNVRKENERCLCFYFLLTNDEDKPSEIEIAEKKLRKKIPDATIYWRRWPQVWKWLRDINDLLKKQAVKDTSLKLLEATIKLLEVEKMKDPTGFKPKWFSMEVINALDTVQTLCREISVTMREVIRKAKNENIQSLGDSLNPTRSKDKLYMPEEWIPRLFDFYFKDEGWTKITEPGTHPSLYISFLLRPNERGIEVGLWWEKPKQEAIEEIRKHVGKEGLKIHEEWLETEGGLAVRYELPVENLSDGRKAVKTLVERLVEMRKFTESLETFHEVLGLEKTSRRTKQAK